MKSQDKDKHCHYSGLPSPLAYEKNDTDYDGMGDQGRIPGDWDKSEWQGRTKRNVEFSTGVAGISIIAFILLLLYAATASSQSYYKHESSTPTADLWKNSSYAKQQKFKPQSYLYLNNHRMQIVMLPVNRQVYNFYNPVVYRFVPNNNIYYVPNTNLINYGYYLPR
jgi:hypothetical protein